MLFSANLGFLWTDRPLMDAIHAAKAAGFDAVECHWPYEVSPAEVKQALKDTDLPMLSLNTIRGDIAAGENGLSALSGRAQDAQNAIKQAVDYASEIGCHNIHVMAGNASGPDAQNIFIDNLTFACALAKDNGLGVLIEPLNPYDAPGYFLNDISVARHIIQQLGSETLRLMFDCYHMQILHGDITRLITDNIDIIGHIQFASVPDRAAPHGGELNYQHIFSVIKALGYKAPLGAEYKPADGDTDASLTWLEQARAL